MFTGIIDLITMRARMFNEDTLGATFEDVDIPGSLLDQANTLGKTVRISTQEEITYKDGRLETNKKQFVIEP